MCRCSALDPPRHGSKPRDAQDAALQRHDGPVLGLEPRLARSVQARPPGLPPRDPFDLVQVAPERRDARVHAGDRLVLEQGLRDFFDLGVEVVEVLVHVVRRHRPRGGVREHLAAPRLEHLADARALERFQQALEGALLERRGRGVVHRDGGVGRHRRGRSVAFPRGASAFVRCRRRVLRGRDDRVGRRPRVRVRVRRQRVAVARAPPRPQRRSAPRGIASTSASRPPPSRRRVRRPLRDDRVGRRPRVRVRIIRQRVASRPPPARARVARVACRAAGVAYSRDDRVGRRRVSASASSGSASRSRTAAPAAASLERSGASADPCGIRRVLRLLNERVGRRPRIRVSVRRQRARARAPPRPPRRSAPWYVGAHRGPSPPSPCARATRPSRGPPVPRRRPARRGRAPASAKAPRGRRAVVGALGN